MCFDREYSEHKHLDAIEKMLELRKEFVDKQTDLFETESSNRLLVDSLRSEVGTLRSGVVLKDGLEARFLGLERSLAAAKADNNGGRVAELENKLSGRMRSRVTFPFFCTWILRAAGDEVEREKKRMLE
jgi:hypothetical protein